MFVASHTQPHVCGDASWQHDGFASGSQQATSAAGSQQRAWCISFACPSVTGSEAFSTSVVFSVIGLILLIREM